MGLHKHVFEFCFWSMLLLLGVVVVGRRAQAVMNTASSTFDRFRLLTDGNSTEQPAASQQTKRANKLVLEFLVVVRVVVAYRSTKRTPPPVFQFPGFVQVGWRSPLRRLMHFEFFTLFFVSTKQNQDQNIDQKRIYLQSASFIIQAKQDYRYGYCV